MISSAQGARNKQLNLIKEEDINENSLPFDSSLSAGQEDTSPKLAGAYNNNRRNHTGGLPISTSQQQSRQQPVSSSLSSFVMKRPNIQVANLENPPFGGASSQSLPQHAMTFSKNETKSAGAMIPKHPSSSKAVSKAYQNQDSMEMETPKLMGIGSAPQGTESQKTRMSLSKNRKNSFGMDGDGSLGNTPSEALFRKNNYGAQAGMQILQRRGTLLSMTGALPGIEYLQATTPSRRLNGKQ